VSNNIEIPEANETGIMLCG